MGRETDPPPAYPRNETQKGLETKLYGHISRGLVVTVTSLRCLSLWPLNMDTLYGEGGGIKGVGPFHLNFRRVLLAYLFQAVLQVMVVFQQSFPELCRLLGIPLLLLQEGTHLLQLTLELRQAFQCHTCQSSSS